jgi:hypothetical protein
MKASIKRARHVVGGMTEFFVEMHDAATGRLFLLRHGGSALAIIRARVADLTHPVSSSAKGFDEVVEVRRNAVYINRPIPGRTVVITSKLDDLEASTGERNYGIRLSAQSMTIVERVGELGDSMDEVASRTDNAGDASG